MVGAAQEEARRLGHPFLGTEHLLLALVDLDNSYAGRTLREAGVDPDDIRQRLHAIIGDGLDPEALRSLGIDLAQVRELAERRFGPGALDSVRRPHALVRHLPVTRRVKTVLERSVRAARRFGQQSIRPEHLLLGMIDGGGGIAIRVLREAGIDISGLRTTITGHLDTEAA